MPFGPSNAPATWQHFINKIFANMVDVSVVVYLDNILIFSDNPEDHKQHVKEVLKHLRNNKLYAGPDECKFHGTLVGYLGFYISVDGLTMDCSKVQVIQDWPEPCKVKDVQSFLGFANFYRCFIHAYSEIVAPLNCLTRKDTIWDFNQKC